MATRMAPKYRYEPGPRHSSGSLHSYTPRHAPSSHGGSEYAIDPPSSSFSSIPTSVTSLSQARGRRASVSERPRSILRNKSVHSPSRSPPRPSARPAARPVVVQNGARSQSRPRSRSRPGVRAPSPPQSERGQRVLVPASSINSRRARGEYRSSPTRSLRIRSEYHSPEHSARRSPEYSTRRSPERSTRRSPERSTRRSPSRTRAPSRTRNLEYHSSARSHRSERKSYHGGSEYGARSESRSRPREYVVSGETPRPRGRTKIPQKLVCTEAVEEMGMSYSLEGEHLFVNQVLERQEIERLVELSEEIKRTGRTARSSPKAVSFFGQTIVHDVTPESPPSRALAFYDRDQHSHQVIPEPPPPASYTEQQLMAARYEPLMPPGPGTPLVGAMKRLELTTPGIPVPGKSREEKMVRAEERAIRAAELAVMKEERAMITGDPRDEREAWKARNRAEDLIAKVEDRERKERMKYEEKASRRRSYSGGETLIGGRRVGRNAKGEVVVIKG